MVVVVMIIVTVKIMKPVNNNCNSSSHRYCKAFPYIHKHATKQHYQHRKDNRDNAEHSLSSHIIDKLDSNMDFHVLIWFTKHARLCVLHWSDKCRIVFKKSLPMFFFHWLPHCHMDGWMYLSMRRSNPEQQAHTTPTTGFVKPHKWAASGLMRHTAWVKPTSGGGEIASISF